MGPLLKAGCPVVLLSYCTSRSRSLCGCRMEETKQSFETKCLSVKLRCYFTKNGASKIWFNFKNKAFAWQEFEEKIPLNTGFDTIWSSRVCAKATCWNLMKPFAHESPLTRVENEAPYNMIVPCFDPKKLKWKLCKETDVGKKEVQLCCDFA